MLSRLCARTRQYSALSPNGSINIWRPTQTILSATPRYIPHRTYSAAAHAVGSTNWRAPELTLSSDERPYNASNQLPITSPTPPTDEPGLSGTNSHDDPLTAAVRNTIQDIIFTPRPRAEAVRELQALRETVGTGPLRSNQRVACCMAGAMIHLDLIPEAFDHLDQTLPHGKQFNLWIFEAYALATLEQCKREDWVPKFVQLAEDRTGSLKPTLVRALAKAYIRYQDFQRLHLLMKTCAKQGVTPNQATFELMIRAHVSNSDIDAAERLMKKMEELGMEMGDSACAAVLAGSRGYGLADDVSALLDGDRAPSVEVLNAALRLCLDARAFDRFQEILELYSFDHPSSTESRLSPNSRTWRILLEASIERKDSLVEILRLLEECIRSGAIPNTSLVALTIRILATHGAIEQAVALIGSLARSHIRYTEELAPILADLDALVNPIPPTPTIPLPFDPSSVSLDVPVLNALLKELSFSCGLHAAEPILRIIHFFHLKPDSDTADLILKSASHAFNNPQKLAGIAEQLVAKKPFRKSRHDWNGTALTLGVHNFLLNRFIFAEESKTHGGRGWMKKLYPTKRRSGLQQKDPDKYHTPTCGIDVQNSRHYHELGLLSANLRERAVRSNHHTYYLRMRREAVSRTDVDGAEKVFSAMKQQGIQPRLSHYRALALGYGLQGDMAGLKRSIRKYEQATKSKPQASSAGSGDSSLSRMGVGVGVGSVLLWSVLVLAYGKLGRPDLAQATFEEMVNEGIVPDAIAVQRLAKSHFINGDVEGARNAILGFWPVNAVGPLTHEIRKLPLKRLTEVLMEKEREATKHTTRRGQHGTRAKLTPKEALELETIMSRILEIWRNPCQIGCIEPAEPRNHPPNRAIIKRRKPPDSGDESQTHVDLGGRMASRWNEKATPTP